jgi:hypothetical protein
MSRWPKTWKCTFFSMKDLLDLDKLLTVDSKKCVLLYFLGFKVTRGVDFQICGSEVTFLLQGIKPKGS